MTYATATEDTQELSYSTREKALRDLFIKEYLIDYNGFAAALRCGFQSVMAGQYSQIFMDEPYVRQRISKIELEGEQGENETEQRNALKKKIMAGLVREAYYHGPGSSHAARVAALGRLSQITGLDVDKTGNGITGGVMVVPGIAEVDEWENSASAQQERLQSDAQLH